MMVDRRTLTAALIKDGRPLIVLTALALLFSGGFALFLSAVRQFLPHDLAFLGMSADELCRLRECRVVDFMVHDRATFGGVLIAIGTVYLWLAEFPLRRGAAWAWWALVLSGAVGFASFLGYLGYGYLDSWHGTATLLLFPVFVLGLALTWRRLRRPRGLRTLLVPGWRPEWRSAAGIGRIFLLLTAVGMMAAGLTIQTIGVTQVFVPQDLAFMGLTRDHLVDVNPRLIPLIAHDRAGFGGGLISCGLALGFAIWCGRPGPALWQTIAIAGATGFGCAIGVHFAVGYTDAFHLAPAVLGATQFVLGLALSARGTDYGLRTADTNPRAAPTGR
jgi:MFS family permease